MWWAALVGTPLLALIAWAIVVRLWTNDYKNDNDLIGD